MARMINTIKKPSLDKARRHKKPRDTSYEIDWRLKISVSPQSLPGTTIFGDFDLKDIKSSIIGFTYDPSNDEDTSIDSGRVAVETSVGVGIFGASVGIDVGHRGDISVSANTGISTPFGDFNVDLTIVKDGCTIAVTKSFITPTQEFSTTEVYTAPGCEPKEPLPTPTPSPSPTPSPISLPSYPPGTFIHLFKLQHTYYPRGLAGGAFPTNESYEIINTGENKYKFITSSRFGISGNPNAVLREGRALNSVYYLGGLEPYVLEKRAGDLYYYLYSSSEGSRIGQLIYWGDEAAFYKAESFNICQHTNDPFVFIDPTRDVQTSHFKQRLVLQTGLAERILPYQAATNGNIYSIQVLACDSTSPKWNPNPMSDDKCCRETASMLRKIMKVLAVEEIEKNGIKIPKEFLAPGGTGQLKVSNYAELQLNLFRTVNRYGIDTPIKIRIKDVNKAKAGDQSVDMDLLSPAAAIQTLVELAIENKGDAATRLHIQVRLIYAVTRTLKMVAGIGETIREIIKMLGSPFKWTKVRLPLEFDLTAGLQPQKESGKGFENKPGKQKSEKDNLAEPLQANDEDTTESLLPAILTPSEYQLPVPRFVETEDDLQDLLMKAILLLGSKK